MSAQKMNIYSRKEFISHSLSILGPLLFASGWLHKDLDIDEFHLPKLRACDLAIIDNNFVIILSYNHEIDTAPIVLFKAKNANKPWDVLLRRHYLNKLPTFINNQHYLNNLSRKLYNMRLSDEIPASLHADVAQLFGNLLNSKTYGQLSAVRECREYLEST